MTNKSYLKVSKDFIYPESQGEPLGSVSSSSSSFMPRFDDLNFYCHNTLDKMDYSKIPTKSSVLSRTTTKAPNSSKVSNS
ncbi:hypothetical protein DSO57_1003088 [Entomophthora muscae]|uniref:Uncharacterized protein n=1 Tax=Entomophthora muscae TaxID=34485 RepID=A0ACC2UJJ2_9FUNG|nr:hypothetical protein DSO57_1003088 [Entomophthora muscae]